MYEDMTGTETSEFFDEYMGQYNMLHDAAISARLSEIARLSALADEDTAVTLDTTEDSAADSVTVISYDELLESIEVTNDMMGMLVAQNYFFIAMFFLVFIYCIIKNNVTKHFV